jgi:hypothetical protein
VNKPIYAIASLLNTRKGSSSNTNKGLVAKIPTTSSQVTYVIGKSILGLRTIEEALE